MVYQAYQHAGEFVQRWLLGILDYYETRFTEMKRQLTDLMNEKPPRLNTKTYNELVEYIDFCQRRYRELKMATEGNRG
jgi:hypothetical protein